MRSRGLVGRGAEIRLAPLSGGVSCDVWRVDTPGAVYAAKRALPQLRTAAEWRAPVERAESEVRWLEYARSIVPQAVPQVLAHDPAEHLFVMPFLEPVAHPVWKDELIAGRVEPEFAGQVARVLVAIHAASAGDSTIAKRFQTDAQFEALRIEPFLLHVASQDATLAPRLGQTAASLRASRIALVHGDVSPKNILVGPSSPILIDAECAVFGDPAFDLAFCLTHLLLKSVWLKAHRSALLASARRLTQDYLAGVTWEDAALLDTRAASLTAALLLARVDGKSPATYLDEADGNVVRRAAARSLLDTALTLSSLLSDWPDHS